MTQEVDFKQQAQGEGSPEKAPRQPMTEQQLMATRSMIQVAMARERAVIAMAQAKIAQMEVDYCELELQFRSQPPA
jgi:hypothetical protein